METTLNQEGLSFGSTELMVVLALSLIALLIIVVIYYRRKLRKARKVIIRLMCEKAALDQAGHKILPMLAMILLLTAACVNKLPGEEEVPPFVDTEANSSLSIITRTGEEDAVISYPIHIYVFRDEKCIEKKTLNQGSKELPFNLPAGSYTVYALAGATDTDYNLPTVETAQPKSVISLKEGKSHADLMISESRVVLEKGIESSHTITLKRKVMMLNSVAITNLPADITAVSLSISPIHESIQFDGSYTTEASSINTIALTKSADNTAWTASKSYFLPGNKNATIALTTTGAQSSKKSSSFDSDKILTENYMLNIEANYIADGNISISGIITGTNWAGTTKINFGLNENGSTADAGDSGTGDITDKIPQAGDIYRGCYVLISTATAGSGTSAGSGATTTATLTLLAPKEMTGVNNNATAIAAAIATAISAATAATADAAENSAADATTTPITGWRLPTEAEARTLFNACHSSSTPNTVLATIGGTALVPTNPYFCTEEGATTTFKIGSPSFGTDAFTSTATVRPVAAINLTLAG